MFTNPVFQCKDVINSSLVKNDVEHQHNQKSVVVGQDHCRGVKVSIKLHQHPGGKYQNSGQAAQGNSH